MTECEASEEASGNITKPNELSQPSPPQTPFPSDGEEKITTGETTNIESENQDVPAVYIQGARLHLITIGVCLTLFLTNLEIPIVTTSLVSITNDLHSFDQTSWIISSYLLGYVSMLIIWAKLSDIFGRKSIAVISLLIFVLFSGACGAAHTMTQLQNRIIFRAFQGLGGGGNYALGTIILLELVPPELFPKYTGIAAVVFSISLLLGPILGGAISTSGWRWIFLLNVPAGAPALAILVFCLPSTFPFHRQGKAYNGFGAVVSKDTWLRVDSIGAVLLLIATTFLVAALEEAGQEYAWRSAFVISLMTITGVTCIAFILWERRVTPTAKITEPIFPWRLMTSRIWIGMTFNALFLGGPWFVTIFQLPQRFRLVDQVSALNSGIRLIPFTLASPFGSGISAAVAGKAKIPPLYIVIFASVLQVVGFTLLSNLPTSSVTSHAQYGYQVIAGFGVGINISTLVIMTPYLVEPPIAVAAVSQFRVLGGVLGIAIATAAYKTFIFGRLNMFLTGDEVKTILQATQNIDFFSSEVQAHIRTIFAEGYNLQFKIMIAFSAAQIPSSLLMWQEKQILV
ncbi:MFS multidrug transporter-like protein [Stipitochalara longipes BDJ]|nr:MFS multidrug transporter-like protein [Stipitochalara longipes BDJ]